MNKNLYEVLELLENDRKIYSILKQCPYEVIREIKLKRYRKNEFSLNQGEIHDVFYIIVDGEVDIYVASEHGKKYFLTKYEKGQYIGELEIFRQASYISSVEAKNEVAMLEVKRDIFLKWIEIDRNFSAYIIRTLCDSTYFMCQNMGFNTLYSLKQRICQSIIEHADKRGKILIPLKTETLSEQMAVTQRSVNRVLKQLKEKSMIDVDKNGVIIKDYEALLRESENK